jgi:undecaprenyl-diphosphatase
MIEIFTLSLVQGITEFIPVSSSSHLFLLASYIDYENQSLSVDVSLHIGSFIAVVTYFNKVLINFIRNKDLFLKILLSSIPVMLIGFFLVKTDLIEKIRNIEVIAWTTFLFGVLLYYSDRFKLTNNIKNNFNLKSVFFIGLFQVLSLIPGVSRSGITITAARFLNYKRFDAAKISFLLSIPTLGAVSIFGLYEIAHMENVKISLTNIYSILFSFIFSYFTIKYFLEFIKKFSLKIFAFYRIILGLILLLIVYL